MGAPKLTCTVAARLVLAKVFGSTIYINNHVYIALKYAVYVGQINSDSDLVERYYDMCTLSESAALKLANASPEEFVNHNKRFLSRIYPNSMRVDSSNYNPQDLWNCGCQLGRSTIKVFYLLINF